MFAGSITLHKPVLGIVAGVAVAAIGIGYVALEFVPAIEPPANMREASGAE